MWQSVNGERHFEIGFDRPVRLERIEEDVAEAFQGPLAIVGNRFANLLSGGGGADRLRAAGGDDLLRGGRGADRLDGGAGGDRLVGGRGDDRLLGARGADEMTGGAGADVFEFRAAHRARDLVGDFEAGRDVIDLSRIDARADRSGDQSFRLIGEGEFSGRSGELRFADGLLRGDVDGDGADDLVVELAGLGRSGRTTSSCSPDADLGRSEAILRQERAGGWSEAVVVGLRGGPKPEHRRPPA
jgi:Ca2+-binding RTX toxin-like protein